MAIFSSSQFSFINYGWLHSSLLWFCIQNLALEIVDFPPGDFLLLPVVRQPEMIMLNILSSACGRVVGHEKGFSMLYFQKKMLK